MDKKRHEALQNVNLVDVSAMSVNEDLVKYNDDELVIVDKLREIPQLGIGKIDFNVVAACITGCMRLEVSGQPTTVNAQQIFVCHPHVVLSNLMISPDFECKVMCLSDRLLRSILQSQMLIWNNMLYKQRYRIIDIPSDRFGLYNELRYQWINEENLFCSTLVDRIVPGRIRDPKEIAEIEAENGYSDPLLDVGEVFGVWYIEGPQWLEDKLPL